MSQPVGRTEAEKVFLGLLLSHRELDVWTHVDSNGPWLCVTRDFTLNGAIIRTLRLDYDGSALVGGWSPAALNWDDGVRAHEAGIGGEPPDGIMHDRLDPTSAAFRAGEWFDMHTGAWALARSAGGLGAAAPYVAISVSARLAAALRAVEVWLGCVGIDEPEITELLEHMWSWLTVTPETFASWNDYGSELLTGVLRGEAQGFLTPIVDAIDIDVRRMGLALTGVVSLVYAHLFGSIDHEVSLRSLRSVADAVGKEGVSLLPPSAFGTPWLVNVGDWGGALASDVVRAWRTA